MLASVSDLAVWTGQDATAPFAARAELLLDAASETVRGYCNQRLDRVYDDTVELAGGDREVLLLPELPVETVTTVLVDGDPVTEFTFDRQGVLVRDDGEPWTGIVTVTYTHGYDPIPSDAAGVVLQLASRALGNPAALQSESETIGSYSHSQVFGVGGTGGFGLSAQDRAVLDRYRISS